MIAVELSGNHDRRTFEDQIDDGWFLETAVDENVVRQRFIGACHCFCLTDTSEKKQVETYVWANKDDPNLYGEWDFEEWRRLHMDKFIEASTKFIEWKKNPGS